MSDELPEEIIRRAQTGDSQAFEQILDCYEMMLCRIVARYFPDETDQQEALSEIYLTLVRALPSFAFRSMFSTWLYGLAQRTCLRLLRAQRRKPCGAREVPEIPDPRTDPADIYEGERRVERLRSALGRLNGDYREVIRLRLEEGRSVEETAQILGKSYTAVTTLLYRALKALKAHLEEEI